MRVSKKALALVAATVVATPATPALAQGINPSAQQTTSAASQTKQPSSAAAAAGDDNTCAPMHIVAVHGKSGAEGADTTTDQGLLGDVVTPVLMAANEQGADVTGGIGATESSEASEPSEDSGSNGIQIGGGQHSAEPSETTGGGVAAGMSTNTEEKTTETEKSGGGKGVAAGMNNSGGVMGSGNSSSAETTSQQSSSQSEESSSESESASTTTAENGIEIAHEGVQANVARTYIAFEGGREGAFIPGVHDAEDGINEDSTYSERIESATEQTLETLDEIDKQCPNTKIAIIGHAEGAQAAGNAARAVGNGDSIDPNKIVGVSLLADPSRGDSQQVGSPSGMDTEGAQAPEGQGIATLQPQESAAGETDDTATGSNDAASESSSAPQSADTRTAPQAPAMPSAPGGDYGALTDKTASWCIEGDATCAVVADSPLGQLVSRSDSSIDVQDPQGSLDYVASTLSPAVTLGTVEGLADSLDFGPNGFTFNRASSPEETTIGRIATETEKPADLGETSGRLLAAGAKLGGMGLAAGVTVAKEAITAENIADVVAAGAVDPGLGAGVAGMKLFDAAVDADLINIDTLATGTQRLFDEAQGAGLDETDLNDAAVSGAITQAIGTRDYQTTPVNSKGESATQATTGWLINAAADVLGSDSPQSLTDATSQKAKTPHSFNQNAVTTAMDRWA